MRWLLFPIVASLLGVGPVAVAQPKGPPAAPGRDAGVGAQVHLAPTAAPDGGAEASASASGARSDPAAAEKLELERLRRELSELRERTALLERQATQTELLSTHLEKMSHQLGELREEFSAAETRRQETERRAAERKAQTESAAAGLVSALQALSTGATNIDGALRAAEAVFTGAALRDVQYARSSLANGDLYAARYYLSLALMEAEAGRY